MRGEIDRREAAGQFVAGRGGTGGAHAMRTPEERVRRQKAIVSALPPLRPCNRSTLLPRAAPPRLGRLLDNLSPPTDVQQMPLLHPLVTACEPCSAKISSKFGSQIWRFTTKVAALVKCTCWCCIRSPQLLLRFF